MKIILLKDIRKVGKKYETKEVADGFAMNSLIPRNLALQATGTAEKHVEALRAQDSAAKSGREAGVAQELEKIAGVTIAMRGKANEQGHLFAAIHAEDLIDELRKESGLEIDAEHIKLDKPVKEAGEHMIPVEVAGKRAEFKLVIEAE